MALILPHRDYRPPPPLWSPGRDIWVPLRQPLIRATAPLQNVDATTASATSVTFTTANAQKGNSLVVFVGNNSGGSSIASGQGGVTTWNLAKTNAGGANDSDLWYGTVDGTPSTSVVATFPVGRAACKLIEWPGRLLVDQSNTAFATSVTVDPGSVTPTTGFQVIFALGVVFTTIVSGPTGGFTSLGIPVSGTFSSACAVLEQGAAAAADPTWTIASTAWVGVIASFKQLWYPVQVDSPDEQMAAA